MTTAIVPYSKTIILTRNKVAIVSYWMYEWIIQWKWYTQSGCTTCYAATSFNLKNQRSHSKNVTMHRFILGLTNPRILVDHKDRNGLNNCDNNLRIATRSQNNANRRGSGKSKYLGVAEQIKTATRKVWLASIRENNKRKHLGLFPYTCEGEIEAAKCYDKAALRIHGKFANLNFPISITCIE